MFEAVDVIIPIHPSDLFNIGRTQFTTRSIYNAFPPFNYSLVFDISAIWCSPQDPDEVFEKFKQSSIDLSFTTRKLNEWHMSGFAVLYRANRATFQFWKDVVKKTLQMRLHIDDQYPIQAVTRTAIRTRRLRFSWASNNMFFASHGVDKKGKFVGGARCYRSSVLINGRVRFMHFGIDYHCRLMNGRNNEYSNRTRAFFGRGNCKYNTTNKDQMVFSQAHMNSLVAPFSAPKFDWTLLEKEDPDSLFWFKSKVR